MLSSRITWLMSLPFGTSYGFVSWIPRQPEGVALADRFDRCALPRLQPFQQVVADAHRVRHDRQRRIHRAARHEEAAVDHVEIVELVRLAVRVEGGCARVMAESHG